MTKIRKAAVLACSFALGLGTVERAEHACSVHTVAKGCHGAHWGGNASALGCDALLRRLPISHLHCDAMPCVEASIGYGKR